jgi:hypothetical protein
MFQTKIMKIMKVNKIVVLLLLTGFAATAQSPSFPDTTVKKSKWDKKFLWGATFNNSWATINGSNMPNEYFWKPSVGASLKTEFYFQKNIGLLVGLQYQQKGSGIITEDKVKELGNPDSTYRARIKLHALEVPISIVLRSGDIIKNARLHGAVGISPMINFESRYVLYSAEDGFHFMENQDNRYYKNDLALNASVGVDINAGNSCIFQMHLYGTWGTKNVYSTDFFPNANGKTRIIGLKLGWLF